MGALGDAVRGDPVAYRVSLVSPLSGVKFGAKSYYCVVPRDHAGGLGNI
jgi:hypothetical protein